MLFLKLKRVKKARRFEERKSGESVEEKGVDQRHLKERTSEESELKGSEASWRTIPTWFGGGYIRFPSRPGQCEQRA